MTLERGSTAAEFSFRRFGGPTRVVENPVTSTVATSVTELLRNNPKRIFWLIMNRSVNNGALGFSREVTLTSGLLIAANGGQWSMDLEEDGEAVTYPVFAINDAASGSYYVLEIERV